MKKSLSRKRLLMLSVLLLAVCGQMWAERNGVKGASDSYDGINYTLYSDYSYYCYWSQLTAGYGNVAVITSCSNSTMVIPESLGGCNQIVIGEGALTKNVKSLTISKSVRVLEYCAVYYADQIETLIIEDSETPLYCGGTKYSKSYGAFSFIEKLKSVYIGRDLEYEYYNGDYTYAPFRYCESTGNFDVTIGPRVKRIADYCFEGCNVKSMKVMPQNPPYCGTDAFGGVTNSIPVYVSYKTRSAYSSASGWSNFTNYVLDTELCKADALNDLDAEAGENPSATVQGVVSDYKGQINAASSGDVVVEKLNAGKAAIQLQKAKDAAIAALNTEAGGSPSQAVAGVRDTWITNVNNAGTITDVETQKNNGIAAIQLQKAKDAAIAALNTEAGNSPSEAVANVRDTSIANVNNAGTIADVETQKNNGIAAIQLQKEKETAIAVLNEEATTYPSDAADEIVSTYTGKINAATSTTDVTNEKEAGIKALEDAKDLQEEKADAITALNNEAGKDPSDAVKNILNGYTTKINAATSITDVETQKNNGIAAIKLQKEKETAIAALNEEATTYPSDAADEIVSTYTGKINAATSTTDVTKEKEAGIKALMDAKDLQVAKAAAIDELNDAKKANPSDAAEDVVRTYIGKINAAKTTNDVTAEKNKGIQALKDAKDLQEAKEAAIDELNNAKKANPSDAAEGIVKTYTDKINATTTTNDVTAEKNKGIQALKDAKDLQDAKAAAIDELNNATKDYPSDESEDIVSAYTGKINAATTTDAVTAAKEAGIQALAYAAEMPTVLHINFAEGSAPIEKEHYMVDSKFTLDEDCNVVLTVNSNSVTYPWDMAGKISLSKSVPTIELKANKDPESESDYYTTFYSSLETYAIPEGVKAYTATMDEKQTGVILLNEIENGIIPAETAVVLISESDSYSAYSSTYAISETEEARGILKGTDVEISAAANCYILSGTSTLGMGLYPWAGEGKTLAANKAYLQLTESSQAKAFRFKFDDETTSIESLTPPLSEGEGVYNLQGIRVNDNYKGIVIKNGKKTLNK